MINVQQHYLLRVVFHNDRFWDLYYNIMLLVVIVSERLQFILFADDTNVFHHDLSLCCKRTCDLSPRLL